ncbi:XFP N-terminal domain-containing protein [Hysterangium stoloniferum]|nr:XFP N-terminal domain-containing protein [Hysterangium stoloniferum]
MDNLDLIIPVVIGDGEAETGPTAWHGYKFLDPAESGAIIPIIHVNGFKITLTSTPTSLSNSTSPSTLATRTLPPSLSTLKAPTAKLAGTTDAQEPATPSTTLAPPSAVDTLA